MYGDIEALLKAEVPIAMIVKHLNDDGVMQITQQTFVSTLHQVRKQQRSTDQENVNDSKQKPKKKVREKLPFTRDDSAASQGSASFDFGEVPF